MKKSVLKILALTIVMVLFVSIAYSTGQNQKLPNNPGVHKVQMAFSALNADIDTLKYVVEPGIAALTFFIYSPDSCSFDRVTIRRVNTTLGSNTINVAVATIDTLSLFTALSQVAQVANQASVQMQAVTLAPYCDEIWFIVDRASGDNGVTNTTAYYGVYKTYYTK